MTTTLMTSLLYCCQGVLVVHRCVFSICGGTDDHQLLVLLLFRTFWTDFTGHCHKHVLYCDFKAQAVLVQCRLVL